MSTEVHYRSLEHHELARLGEIDRSERIVSVFEQHGERLVEIDVDLTCPPWLDEGDSDHTIAHQRAECERYLRAGGSAIGAFAGDRLLGIAIVVPGIRPGIAQIAFLYVSDGFRGSGVGVTLMAELERIAREAGDTAMVVTSTPSANTVRFYLGRGYEPMGEPLPELFALEPEDVHMRKAL